VSWHGRGRTAVVGVGFSELGRNVATPLGRLAIDACNAAIEDAGLRPTDIDGLATYPDQPFLGAGNREGEDLVPVQYLMNHLDLAPDIRWYAQVSAGLVASAVIEAVNALLAGACEYVLVWRAMHQPKGTYNAWRSNVALGDTQFTAPYGFTAPFQVHAVGYRRYLERFGANREDMATLAVQQREYANLNDKAYFHDQPLTREDYLGARIISDPLCLFDCDIPVEGCAALVLTTAERARDCRQPPAYIAGYGQHTARRLTLPVYMLDDYMATGGSTTAKMWERSGLGPSEVDAAMLYDGFSPSVYYWLEAAGLCPEGEAARFIQDGRIALDGELPVNTFGGSLSEGRLHGMGHLAEAVAQVTGRAGPRQVADCEVAIVTDGSPLLRGAGLVFTQEP
jgi:acetyl-CoA acetyltransferase